MRELGFCFVYTGGPSVFLSRALTWFLLCSSEMHCYRRESLEVARYIKIATGKWPHAEGQNKQGTDHRKRDGRFCQRGKQQRQSQEFSRFSVSRLQWSSSRQVTQKRAILTWKFGSTYVVSEASVGNHEMVACEEMKNLIIISSSLSRNILA